MLQHKDLSMRKEHAKMPFRLEDLQIHMSLQLPVVQFLASEPLLRFCPSARIMLLKLVDKETVTFETNYHKPNPS